MAWPTIQLGDVAHNRPGAIAIGPFGSAMKADTYSETGVRVIRGTNISETRAWKGDWVFVPSAFVDKMSRCEVFGGDLVFPHRGSIGEVAIIPDDGDRYFLSTSLMKISVDPSRMNPLFAYYYLRSYAGRGEILRFGSQVGTPGIGQPLASLRQFRIPAPPLETQAIIASILAALDDKIELNRRMNATLERQARALFRDWFVDFGPTRAKQSGAPAYLVPDLWNLFPATLDPEGKPEGWQERPLTAFFDIIGGGTPKTSVAEFWDGDMPWYSVTDTPPNGSVFVIETEKTITAAGVAGSSVRVVPAGTTIISARGTVGNLAVTGRDMTFNQSCYGLRGKDGVGDAFVFLASQHMVTRLQAMSHGSVFSTITRDTFAGIALAHAGATVFEAFEKLVAPIFAKIKTNVEQSRTLAQTRDLLLPKLMSGEIRVRDAENVAGLSR